MDILNNSSIWYIALINENFNKVIEITSMKKKNECFKLSYYNKWSEKWYVRAADSVISLPIKVFKYLKI